MNSFYTSLPANMASPEYVVVDTGDENASNDEYKILIPYNRLLKKYKSEVNIKINILSK